MSTTRRDQTNKANREKKSQGIDKNTQYQTASQQRRQNRLSGNKGERPNRDTLRAEVERDRLINQLWV